MMVTLCDTSPLVALINRKDTNHKRAASVLQSLTGSLLTTWPCMAEAMHLLDNAGSWPAQDALWALCEDGALEIHQSGPPERTRMRILMAKYRSTPMDLGDASLVAAAESLGVNQVFTFDRDFFIYRADGTKPFDVIP